MNILKTSRFWNFREKSWLFAILICFVLTASLILMFLSLSFTRATIDEGNYLKNGKELVRNFRWDTQLIRNHPPLVFYFHGAVSLTNLTQDYWSQFFYARLSMFLIYIIFAFVLLFLTKKLFGIKAALFSLILFCFSPEILAHGRLITPDLTLALFFFLFTFSFYQFIRQLDIRTSLAAGFFLGLALLTKYTALLLIPISFFSIFFYEIFFDKQKKFFERLKWLLVLYVIAVFIVNIGYGFSGFLQMPNKFKSNIFASYNRLPVINSTLRIFPKAYIQGVDWQLNESQKPWLNGNFFMGRWSQNGFWDFFFLTFLLKTPFPLLVLILVGLFFKARDFLKGQFKFNFLDFLIFWEIFFLFLYFSFLNNLNIGFRYILMIYPLLFFWVSNIVNKKFKSKKITIFYNFLLVFLIFWYVWGTVKIHPYYLAFANELIGGPKNAWRYWADSTLDWGQDNERAFDYLRKYPEILVNPRKIVVGKIAVSVNSLNIFHYNDYLWLRKLNKQPINNIGYTWLIFNITQKDVEKIKKEFN